MELSEISELNRVLAPRNYLSNFPSIQRASSEGMVEYTISIFEELKNSPVCSVPLELDLSPYEETEEKQKIKVKKNYSIL